MKPKFICPICYSENVQVESALSEKVKFLIRCNNCGNEREYSKFEIDVAITNKEEGYPSPKDFWKRDSR